MNRLVAVVDDDKSVRRSFSRLLRAASFEPVGYPSAEAYLDDPAHTAVACLVLDVQLHGMSGLELKARLAAAGESTPVILVTAHDVAELRSRAEAAGCAGYFLKSDPGAAVLEAIRAALVEPGR